MSRIRSSAELVDHLATEVSEGRLLPGDRLPPVRTLARELDLAPNTVASAYRTLGDRGLLVGRGRAGTFVAEPFTRTAPEPVVPVGVTDLALGNPDPRLLPDIASVLERIEPPATLYGGDPVLTDFEVAVRRHVADLRGAFAAVNGALDGVERVLAVHLEPGDRVGVEDPGWPVVFDLMRAMRLRAVPIPVDDEGPTAEGLDDVVDGLDAVLLTSRMQNPTGACVSRRRAGELLTIIERRPDLLTVEDDHASVIAGAPLHVVGPGRERWAVVQSFSKALAPDLRVAALTGDDRTVRAVLARQAVGPGWVSHLSQKVAAVLLDDPSVRAGLAEATIAYAERRALLAGALADIGWESRGRSGLNLWVPVPDEASVVKRCLEAGYAVRAGEPFRIRSGPAVRVTISTIDHASAVEVARAVAGAGPNVHTRSG